MGKEIPPEELIIPPQDSKICGTICLCQMTAVLSSVALVYLTVAIYMPSLRAFESGIIETPVMCTTVKNNTVEICEWGSCGEWCLSKSSGSCTQIWVNLRRNGSNLIFQNCTQAITKACHGIDKEKVKKHSCIQDECKNLTGTFNCTMGDCINITEVFECRFNETDPAHKCTGTRGKVVCVELDGLFDCNRGRCKRIRPPYMCERKCQDMPTHNKNVILLYADYVFLGQCKRAIVDDGIVNGTDIVVWNDTLDNTLMASCYTVTLQQGGTVEANDCINGTLVEKGTLGSTTNYSVLSTLSYTNDRLLDENLEITPPESLLIIANDSKLHINLEGCVNTLRGECAEFFKQYGRDGSDHTARARFPCFYSESNTEKVVARFDLDETYKQFLIASVLPACLFVLSCTILVLCQKTVEVGDDAKMRFKACSGGENETATEGGDAVMAL